MLDEDANELDSLEDFEDEEIEELDIDKLHYNLDDFDDGVDFDE